MLEKEANLVVETEGISCSRPVLDVTTRISIAKLAPESDHRKPEMTP